MPPKGQPAGTRTSRAERYAHRHGETAPTSADEEESDDDDNDEGDYGSDAGGPSRAGSALGDPGDESDTDDYFDLADPPPYTPPPQPPAAGGFADGDPVFVGRPLFGCARKTACAFAHPSVHSHAVRASYDPFFTAAARHGQDASAIYLDFLYLAFISARRLKRVGLGFRV
jgi:hypothetical protein